MSVTSTSTASKKQRRFALTLASSLVAGCLSLYLGSLLPELDQALRHGLADTFGQQTSVNASGTVAPGAVCVLVIAFAACLVGSRLTSLPRSICLLQLFVVSVLLQWFALYSKLPSSPAAYLLAIATGCGVGYWLRLFWQQETKHQAQYYELVLRNHELQEARLQMARQDEVDRRLLAADLHDQVLNDLKLIAEKVNALKANPGQDPGNEIETLLQQTMTDIREVMDSLSPATLEHLGLPASLEDLLRRAAERGGFRTRFEHSLTENDLSAVGQIEQILLYRIVQECCTNICKHSQAKRVKGSLERDGKRLIVTIVDDGVGIDPSINSQQSRGFNYMRQRADLIGAQIAWLPGDEGRGTKVEIRMPLVSETT